MTLISVEKNPLIFPILNILKGIAEPISEHALITRLQQLDAVNLSLAGSLNLFQTHFMVMNALYYWQEELAKENYYLHISALNIYLEPIDLKPVHLKQASPNRSDVTLDGDVSLRDYYLDWGHFEATAEEVESLLAGFWRSYANNYNKNYSDNGGGHGNAQKQQALAVLKLPGDAEWPAIKQTYRRLIAEEHPDRGGDALTFIEIRQAYEILLTAYAE